MENMNNKHYESPSASVEYIKFEGIICGSVDPKWNDPFEKEKGW